MRDLIDRCPISVVLTFLLGIFSLSTNYLGVASMVMLVYDHLLTFDDEVWIAGPE